MDLKKYKLGDIADIIPGYAFKSTDFLSGENIVIKIKDIEPPFIDVNNADKVGFRPNDKYRLEYGDFVLAMTGATIGKVGVNNTHIPNVYINQRVCKFIPNEGLCDKNYLYYLLNTDAFRNFIYKNIDSASAQPNIGHPSILKFEHYFPNIEGQKRIGNLLSSLDQKIALNRKINDNLEAMAKQLYDYWFVQFDFPNEEGKPYKSSGGKMLWNKKLKREIPEGWEVEKLGDIIQELESGKRPKGGIEKSLKQGIPSLGAEAISKLGDFDYSKTPYIPYNTKINSGIIKNNDILIYKDGAYVGKVTLYRDNFPFEFATINEHVFLLRTTDPKIQEYIFFTLEKDYFFNIMQNLGKAKAAQPGLNKDDLKSIEILSPKKEIIYKYRTIIEPLMANLFNSAKQIAALTKQRDELLPLLMNGQVSVNYD